MNMFLSRLFYLLGLLDLLVADNCNVNTDQLQQLQLLQENYSHCSQMSDLEKENYELRRRLAKAESENEKLTFSSPTCISELTSHKIIMTIPTIYKEYILSLDVKPIGPRSGWRSILHFTATGKDTYTAGQGCTNSDSTALP